MQSLSLLVGNQYSYVHKGGSGTESNLGSNLQSWAGTALASPYHVARGFGSYVHSPLYQTCQSTD